MFLYIYIIGAKYKSLIFSGFDEKKKKIVSK